MLDPPLADSFDVERIEQVSGERDTTLLLDEDSKLSVEAYRRWAVESLPDQVEVSVVVPAYNEEWRILPTIGAIANHMSSLGKTWELIVSDDGSTDRTVELVRNLNLPGLKLLEADQNGGKGSAVRRGVFEARGQLILFADADQSTPIEQFELLASRLEGGHQVVVASRGASGASVANKSAFRELMSSGLRRLVTLGLGLSSADTQCGFKLFSREAAWDLFGRQTIDGFSFDLEILFLANKYGYGVAEVPIRWFDAPGSKVESIKVARRFLADIVRIRWLNIFGSYSGALPREWAERRILPGTGSNLQLDE